MQIEQMTLNELIEYVEAIEKNDGRFNHKLFCPNHEFENYLYEFQTNNMEYDIPQEPLHRIYFELGKKFAQVGEKEKAIDAFTIARNYNPVDIEIMIDLAIAYSSNKEFNRMRQILDEMYSSIYTKKDISQYYALLGSYYLEEYKPQVAEALDMYSNLFCNNQQAQKDLAYIKEAVGLKLEKASIQQLQQVLIKNNIPLQPKQETLALLYQVAILAKEEKVSYSKQLLQALYELTADEEVKELLDKM